MECRTIQAELAFTVFTETDALEFSLWKSLYAGVPAADRNPRQSCQYGVAEERPRNAPSHAMLLI